MIVRLKIKYENDQALNFTLESSTGKGHLYEVLSVNLYKNLAQGTTAKAQGTTAKAQGTTTKAQGTTVKAHGTMEIAVGTAGYFLFMYPKICMLSHRGNITQEYY